MSPLDVYFTPGTRGALATASGDGANGSTLPSCRSDLDPPHNHRTPDYHQPTLQQETIHLPRIGAVTSNKERLQGSVPRLCCASSPHYSL